jgi:hypothetical protein
MMSVRPWHLAVFACTALTVVIAVVAILAASSRNKR